jgi:hypothetical protein
LIWSSRISGLLSRRRPVHPWLTAIFAAVAVGGVLYFLTAVSVAEALRPMYDPVQRTISELAVGHAGYLQVSAFVVLGVGLLALPCGLWSRVRATLASRAGLGLLLVCGVSSFVAAAFPTDLRTAAVATVTGQVHEVSAGIGYACLMSAMLLLSWHFRRDAPWRSHRHYSAFLSMIGLATLLALAASGEGPVTGLLQRLMAVSLLSWVALTGVHACRLSLAARPARGAPR